ncbi:MAG: hypothetical protein R3B40_13970 [Polyangiales bacterium]
MIERERARWRQRMLAGLCAGALVGCASSWVHVGSLRKEVRAPVPPVDVPTAPFDVVLNPHSMERLVDRLVPSRTLACEDALRAVLPCPCEPGVDRVRCCDLDDLDAALTGSCGLATGVEATNSVGDGDLLMEWLADETARVLGRRLADNGPEDGLVTYDLSRYTQIPVDYAIDLDDQCRAVLERESVHLRIVRRFGNPSAFLGEEVEDLQEILERPELGNVAITEIDLRTFADGEVSTPPAETPTETLLDEEAMSRCAARQPRLFGLLYARLGACYEPSADAPPPPGTEPGACVPTLADEDPLTATPGLAGAVLLEESLVASVDGDCSVRVAGPTGTDLRGYLRQEVRNLDLVIDLESPLPFREPTPGPCLDDPSSTCYVARPLEFGGWVWISISILDIDEGNSGDLLDSFL